MNVMRKWSCAVPLVLLSLAAVAGCGEEEVPTFPSYALHIQPLMRARCVRCHGANGTLNMDPDLTFMTNPPRVPKSFYAGTYEDTGVGCELMPVPTTCHRGARFNAVSIKTYVHLPEAQRMPPPPAERLTDREIELIDRWAANPLP
jgi:hypothetical protein